MIVRALAITFFASLPLFARADDADAKKAAKAQADEIQTALIKGDYEKFVGLTHPKIVEGSVGAKKMTELLTTEIKKMSDKGFTFKSVAVHEPSDPLKAGKDLYIVVPFTLEMTFPSGRGHQKSALLGVSSDGGKKWVFADTAPGRAVLKKVFPELPEKLEIPKKEPPTVIKD